MSTGRVAARFAPFEHLRIERGATRRGYLRGDDLCFVRDRLKVISQDADGKDLVYKISAIRELPGGAGGAGFFAPYFNCSGLGEELCHFGEIEIAAAGAGFVRVRGAEGVDRILAWCGFGKKAICVVAAAPSRRPSAEWDAPRGAGWWCE